MANKVTFDALWNELKSQSDEANELLEVAEDVATIINDITKARINKGWTQRDLAAYCNIKQSAIARMERLQVIPRLDTVIKIARKLDIQISATKIHVEETVSEPVSLTINTPATTNSDGATIYYIDTKLWQFMI